ncbi:MAG TPA: response regulator [Polyangiaceae bacterium]|nr:response regulator [Polyangiaceae bacterium]
MPSERTGREVDKPHVLVVDDNPLAREGLHLLLRDQFDVVSCASAREALARLGDGFAACVIDLKMPGEGGLELFAAIRRHDEHLPVIIYSAYTDLIDPFELMSCFRPSGYIVKGLNDSKLLEVLSRVTRPPPRAPTPADDGPAGPGPAEG